MICVAVDWSLLLVCVWCRCERWRCLLFCVLRGWCSSGGVLCVVVDVYGLFVSVLGAVVCYCRWLIWVVRCCCSVLLFAVIVMACWCTLWCVDFALS